MDARTRPLTTRQQLRRALTGVRRALLRRRRLIAAALVACAAALALHALAPPAPAAATLTVAARDLPAGTTLTSGDLTSIRVPRGSVPDAVAAAPAGRVLAAPLTRGEAITEPRLVGPHLTDAAPGSTALPVRVSDPGQVALLTVGDRIDLLATDPQSAVTTALVHDVEVLAIPPASDQDSAGSLSGRLVVLAIPVVNVDEVTAASVASFVTYAWPTH